MPGMAFGRVAAPINDEVGPVLDFAQGTGNLTAQLGGYLGGAVSQRRMAIDHSRDQLGQGHGFTLRLAGDVAKTVDQRHVRFVQKVGRAFDGLVDGGGLSVNQCVGIETFGGMVAEPRLAETARMLRLGDPLAIGVQLDIVANASAKGTCRILDYGQFAAVDHQDRPLSVPCSVFRFTISRFRPHGAAQRKFTRGHHHENSRRYGAA
jgi:hypothetical protein